MRREYSIGAALALLAAAALADVPCPLELAAVAGEIGALRSVPAPFSPPCRMIAEDALGAELDRKLRRDLPIAPELFLEALRRTGMVDGEPTALYRRLLDFYGSQVLGFYEPDGDEMVLVEGGAAAAASSRLIWAHEVAHAAQERRFRLPSRLLRIRDNSDAQRAASAIAEGEAMLVMLLLEAPAAADPGSVLDTAATAMAAQARTFTPPTGIPRFFVDDLLFPYTGGLAAVLAAYRGGGWRAVDALLARPPTATAALLFPDRPATGPPLADGDLPTPPPGWEVLLTDTVGAWGLRFWLSRVVAEADAHALAAHWDGDRACLARERTRPHCWALAWRLRCRSEAGRHEIEGVLQRHLPGLLASLCPGDSPVTLAWSSSGRTLDVRAGWPQATRPPTQ